MISTEIQIRFSDCDMGGHVHNAVYLNYFEIARIGFFINTIGSDWNWKKDGLIIKKNVIEYNTPVFIEDKIRVNVNCTHIGNKSFTLSYEVIDGTNQVKATGESLVVCFDYTIQSTVNIPAKMKSALEAHLNS